MVDCSPRLMLFITTTGCMGLVAVLPRQSPAGIGNPMTSQLLSVTATDQFTVEFKWKTSNPEVILETVEASDPGGFEASEAVTLWGNLNDWHHAIGSGPFILQDYVSGSSATLVKNPNYWGHATLPSKPDPLYKHT